MAPPSMQIILLHQEETPSQEGDEAVLVLPNNPVLE